MITIDIETKSDKDIAKCGVYAYADSPYFDILLFAYSVDGQPVQVIDTANGEEIPENILAAIADENVIKRAFNVNFERVCLSKYLRENYSQYFQSYSIAEDTVGSYLDPKSWHCSMIHARTLGLPSSLAEVGSVLGIEQQVVDVGGAAVKGGVQEAKLRGQRDMAGGAGMEFVQVMIIPQLQCRCLHRADGANEIPVHRVPRVRLKFIVPALVGYIVGVRSQQDQVVGLSHVQCVDQPTAEILPGGRVLQLRLPHGLQQAMLVTVRYLRRGKCDIHQVLAQGPGEGLFQKAQIHFLLLLLHEAHRGVDPGNDLLIAVDIAAKDLGNAVFIQLEAPADLVEFFLIHGYPFPSVNARTGRKCTTEPAGGQGKNLQITHSKTGGYAYTYPPVIC